MNPTFAIVKMRDQGGIQLALKVIGAGLGRTGTASFKLAMEHLGYGPCHHMSEVFANVHVQLPLWLAAKDGDPDWDAIFDGFASCNDHPSSDHWRELHAKWPQAKVIVTTRSPESWYKSVSSTIYNDDNFARMPDSPLKTFVSTQIGPQPRELIRDEAAAIEWYRAREAEIVATVPAEQLLILPIGSGWEPLCEFLGIPVPDIPYPRVNSTQDWYDAFHTPPPPGAPEGFDGVAAMGKGLIAAWHQQAWG